MGLILCQIKKDEHILFCKDKYIPTYEILR